MPGRQNFLDDVSNDLAIWIDQTANEVALAFAPARAPFSANVTEQQKLDFYRARLFNPDGSPNQQGRSEEIGRLGAEGFGRVYKAVVDHYPDLKPPEAAPIEVPEEWPKAPPGPPAGAPGPGPVPPGPPAGAAFGLPGPPRRPVAPLPPMMPPVPAR